MTLRVELVYDLDCPNVQEARRALLRAFADADIPPSWTEWDRKSPASPASTQLYGSPTILVNGRDVTGVERAEGADRCRIYQSDSGALRRVPPVSSIVAALRHEHALTPGAHIRRASGWRHFLASLPGVSAALLPVGGCPACWPVYAGVLGAVGLTFLLDSAYLLWINSALLGMAWLALTLGARAERVYGPLVLGTVSIGIILFFKFARAFDPLVYAGLSGLVVASLWNTWRKKSTSSGPCPQCAQPEPVENSASRS